MPPPKPPNGQIATGGVLVFVGFLLLGIASIAGRLAYSFDAMGVLYGVGDILIAVGFLLAFLGLARRP